MKLIPLRMIRVKTYPKLKIIQVRLESYAHTDEKARQMIKYMSKS